MECHLAFWQARRTGTIVAEERQTIPLTDATQSNNDTSTDMDPDKDADQDWCPED